ncbi:bifunctional apoptosis regulator-like [Pocillopora damicornis]|uniref:bifunctional apoptosis regulator-like n=1 Tax=Pocillopora damicornis TaxID=46731 RepID=UPI000F54E1AA|nr:bifunctional apoptosis regulator-like [Pocillopora damicornis]
MAKSGQDSQLLKQDLQCGCCFELMVEPTTLSCGHSFCRFCLAKWWHASRHNTCPECRQPWSGFPKVNIALRKTIKVLFSKEEAERRCFQETSPDFGLVLSKFDALENKSSQRLHSSREVEFLQGQNLGITFTKLIFIVLSVLGIVMFIYHVLSLFMDQRDPLVRKPVHKWSTQNVAKWLESLGDWAEEYGDRFQDAGIDGNLLMSLSEYDLETPPLNVVVSYHRRVLLKELEALKADGVKQPTDVWEYKAAYPVRAILLLWGLREFPRLTVFYTFFACNQDVFQPLLYYTSETNFEGSIFEATVIPSEEYLRFVLRLILVPYYLIGKFTLKWINLNYFVGAVVLIYSVLMSLNEFSKLRWLLMMGGWRQLPGLFIGIIITASVNGLFHLALWSFLPSFICDIAFYWMLFLAPYAAWHSFKVGLANGEVHFHPARDFFLWIWRVLHQLRTE